ncbi:AEC family transporter [Rhodobacteraceae bacterium RKSG542]|uniref:AEC family transporter n=1 Tax=Pseudovibrio flavus TaxID=2529854 RepID=UPI0012BC0018|nr:AEC family transporter [Pseudovibrio flavus]MTI16474.1 AEC family transporter [Pseudovibrio flavus]
MTVALNALLPVIFVVVLGWFLKNKGIIKLESWSGLEALCYWVLFPAIIFRNLGTANFSEMPVGAMTVVVLGTFLSLCLITQLLKPALCRCFGFSGPRFTSVFQGIVRWNAFISMGVAGSFIGEEGVTLLAIVIALQVPLVNAICVTQISIYASGTKPNFKKIFRDLATNAYVIATLLGLALNFSGLTLPTSAYSFISMLAGAALPLGMLCVGASINLAALRRPSTALLVGSLPRLCLAPLLAYALILWTGLEPVAAAAVIIAFATPAGGGAYLLAKQLGGDAELMAEILVFQTVVAVFTMTFWLYVLC